jgi:hypothetical protein
VATDQRENPPEINWKHTKGDILEAIAATLRKPNGEAIDLTGCTVLFRMVKSDGTGTPKVGSSDPHTGGLATIDNVAGQVSYTFASGDVDTAGTYYAWWLVKRSSDSAVAHYPPEGQRFRVTITPSY